MTRYKIAEKVRATLFDTLRNYEHKEYVSLETALSAIQLLGSTERIASRDKKALDDLERYVEQYKKTSRKDDLGYVHIDAIRRLDAKRAGDAFVLQMLNGLNLEASKSNSLGRNEYTREMLYRVERHPAPDLALPNYVTFDFDAFGLAKMTNGQPLSSLALSILKTEGLVDDLRLDSDRLSKYLGMIEKGYHDVPYHNSIHATEVLQRVHTILKTVADDVFEKVDRLSLYLAAVIHDYGHAGVTNAFLIASAHPLARQYNDRSPWENHHAASALDPLITMEDMQFMEALSHAEKMHVRKTVIELVLATDMSRHLELMRAISAKADTVGGAGSERREDPFLTFCLILKCADIGHTACEFSLHKVWVHRLQEELYNQGDLERESGLPISAMADRHNDKLTIEASQLAFYDAVVIPMMRVLTIFFAGAEPYLRQACENRERYVKSTN